MKRRDFLKSTAETALETFSINPGQTAPTLASSAASQPKSRLIRTTTGIEPYRGPWNKKTAAHLLRRTMFGPTRAEITDAERRSLNEVLAMLFQDQPLPEPPLNPATGQTWVNSAYDSTNDGVYRNYLKAWWLGLMIRQGVSIHEKMVLFWHNHFATETADVQDSRYMYVQNALFRQHSLGNIKELVRAVTIDPAMLRYLNGNTNIRGRVQENYARELQELFTIGKGAQRGPGDYTNYTEQDVQAAARVITGWRDVRNAAPPRSEFVPSNHDPTNKVFSSAYQGTVIRGGSTAADGPRELNELLDMIFRQAETARFLSRKLYRWFVYYDIDSNVEQNVIEPMAQIMRSNNYEVKPVLEALFRSRHFFDDNNIGCVIKNPIDLVVGTFRQLAIPLPEPGTTTYYSLFGSLRNTARTLQMDPLDPPSVAGWPAFYQIPDFYQLWISTATLPARGGYSDSLITGFRAGGTRYALDSIAYARLVSDPSNPRKLIDETAAHLFPIELTAHQKDYLLRNVLIPGLPDYEWTAEWNAYANDPTNQQRRQRIAARLNDLFRFMMRMAEFQLA